MTGSRDKDLIDRVKKLEDEQEAAKKWRDGVDALINKGKGFWFALLLIGSAIAAAIASLWEVAKHWRGVAGG